MTVTASSLRRSIHQTATRGWQSALADQIYEHNASQVSLKFSGFKRQFQDGYNSGQNLRQIFHALSNNEISCVALSRDTSETGGDKPFSNPKQEEPEEQPERPGELSDQEWEIRTGTSSVFMLWLWMH